MECALYDVLLLLLLSHPQPAFGTHWTQPQLQSCQGIETGSRETRRQRRRRDAKCAEHWEQPVWRRRVWWRMENRQIFWCFLSCTSVCVGGWSVVRAERVDIVDSVLVDVERWDEGWNATSCRHLRQTFVGLWSLLRGRQGQTLPTHRHANPQRSVYILRILTQFYLFS